MGLLPDHPTLNVFNLFKMNELTLYNGLSSIGALLVAAGVAIVMINLINSLRRGRPAPANPWGAATLEWQCSSPPPPDNFSSTPAAGDPYDYTNLEYDYIEGGFVRRDAATAAST